MTFRRTLLPCSLFLLLSCCADPSALAQEAVGFKLTASYDRPGLPVPHWQLRIGTGGKVEYTSDHAAGTQNATNAPVTFQLSQSGGAKLQELLEASHGMKPCETKTKGLARMGMKSVEYQSSTQAAAQCTFNYTDNKPLAAATEYLLGVSYTIEQGGDAGPSAPVRPARPGRRHDPTGNGVQGRAGAGDAIDPAHPGLAGERRGRAGAGEAEGYGTACGGEPSVKPSRLAVLERSATRCIRVAANGRSSSWAAGR